MLWYHLLGIGLWVVAGALWLAALSQWLAGVRAETISWLARLSRSRRVLFAGAVLLAAGCVLEARSLLQQVLSVSLLIATSALMVGWALRAREGYKPAAGDLEAQVSASAPEPPVSASTAPARRMHGSAALLRALGELGVVAVVAPLLWFPTLRPEITILALVALVLIWVLRAAWGGGVWPQAPWNLALALWLLMAFLGALRSVSPMLTFPKVTGLILGLALYRALYGLACQAGSLRKGLVWAVGILGTLSLGVMVVGLIAGQMPGKSPWLSAHLGQLPRLLSALPETQRGQVSLNELGGALLYSTPLMLALALAPRTGARGLGLRILSAVIAAFLAFAIALTQSRSAWAGLVVGALCVVALCWPKQVGALTALVLAGLAGLLVFCRAAILSWLIGVWGYAAQMPLLDPGNWTGRLDLWRRTLSYLFASPWLGGGWGTFRLLPSPEGPHAGSPYGSAFDLGTAHAHNVYLQAAFDFGVPGLVAYLALIVLALGVCWRVYRRSRDGLLRALAIGALASLVAYHIYGLGDVVALGAKPGVLFWGLLGLVAALAEEQGANRVW